MLRTAYFRGTCFNKDQSGWQTLYLTVLCPKKINTYVLVSTRHNLAAKKGSAMKKTKHGRRTGALWGWRSLESPLDTKIQPVHPEGSQP